jgi:hypothetical protein
MRQTAWLIATQSAIGDESGWGKKKLLFHPFNPVILNSDNILSSCGGKKIPHIGF